MLLTVTTSIVLICTRERKQSPQEPLQDDSVTVNNMNWPFVTLARFDDMLREKNTQLAERDRRISELEAERRALSDRLFSAAFSNPARSRTPAQESRPEEQVSDGDASEPKPEASGARSHNAEAPALRRPSQIMRRMDRLAQQRWFRKLHPAKAAEEERDRIGYRP